MRQCCPANGGFSAQFDVATNTLALKNSGTFTTLGNELLLKESDRLITKRAENKLTYNDAEVTLTGYTIDGDLYYPLQGMLDLTGHALETKRRRHNGDKSGKNREIKKREKKATSP